METVKRIDKEDDLHYRHRGFKEKIICDLVYVIVATRNGKRFFLLKVKGPGTKCKVRLRSRFTWSNTYKDERKTSTDEFIRDSCKPKGMLTEEDSGEALTKITTQYVISMKIL